VQSHGERATTVQHVGSERASFSPRRTKIHQTRSKECGKSLTRSAARKRSRLRGAFDECGVKRAWRKSRVARDPSCELSRVQSQDRTHEPFDESKHAPTTRRLRYAQRKYRTSLATTFSSRGERVVSSVRDAVPFVTTSRAKV